MFTVLDAENYIIARFISEIEAQDFVEGNNSIALDNSELLYIRYEDI